jgi:hypothetical protein
MVTAHITNPQPLMQGIAGRNEREDMQRKKAEKRIRKQLQAAREVRLRALLFRWRVYAAVEGGGGGGG